MSRPGGHALKIKCPTWEHVESFYAQKIKDGNVLAARVPFSPRKDEVVTLALELPDELVIAIEARVEEVVPALDGRKSAVKLVVFGLTPAVRTRLEGLVREGGGARTALPARPKPASRPPTSDDAALPVALPNDAPIDEVVEPLILPTIDQIPAAHRAPAQKLVTTLERLRAAAAHDVLGVRWGATVEEIRRGYFELVVHFHPDRFARYGSPAVSLIAQEVFIHINKAYDRMRDAAVAAGEAISAGPALLPHRGWLAGFEDIGAIATRKNPDPDRAEVADAAALPAPTAVGRPAAPAGARPSAAPSAAPRPAPAQAGGAPRLSVAPSSSAARPVAAPPAVAPSASPARGAGAPAGLTIKPPRPAAAPAAAAPVAAAPVAAAPARPSTAQPGPASAPPSAARRPPTAQPAPRPAPVADVPLTEAGLFDGLDDEPSAAAPLAQTVAPRALEADGGQGDAGRLIDEARQDLEAGNHRSARDRLVAVLQASPRDRMARSLYHVAQAYLLASEGKSVDAISQLEAALAHDPSSGPARKALDTIKQRHGDKGGKGGLFGRLFNK